ncbi:MAG: hypothetical protein M3440_10655 [Chloroflexota bacterium]|nr:hypothetical protein [Chloroflexota bacterium]
MARPYRIVLTEAQGDSVLAFQCFGPVLAATWMGKLAGGDSDLTWLLGVVMLGFTTWL